jgi:serine/threonine protein kinase/WD40 repeat protein
LSTYQERRIATLYTRKNFFMDSRSRAALASTDPRIQAALQDYLERIDRGESVDVEMLVARHPDVAEALRSFIDFDELTRRMADRPQDTKSRAATSASGTPRSQAEVTTHSVVGSIEGTGQGNPNRSSPRPIAPSPDDLPEVFGRYRVLKKLGEGAMGAVYLAEDSLLQRKVALKTPKFEGDEDGQLLRRFFREARAVAQLKHPNLCAVYDVGEIDGKHYISMEFVRGKKLQEFIKPDKPMTEKQVMAVVRKIAIGMQEAHTHGVIHRDLKPDNIMINEKGEPVVMDFGLVYQTKSKGSTTITHKGGLVGSPAYMSKEQIEGDPDKLTCSTDQYSLGVILYILLTSKLPFEGGIHAVLAAIAAKEPPLPSQFRPDLNPHLEAVCLKMMAKEATHRYPSMKDAADALVEVAKGTSRAAGQTPQVVMSRTADSEVVDSIGLSQPEPVGGSAGWIAFVLLSAAVLGVAAFFGVNTFYQNPKKPEVQLTTDDTHPSQNENSHAVSVVSKANKQDASASSLPGTSDDLDRSAASWLLAQPHDNTAVQSELSDELGAAIWPLTQQPNKTGVYVRVTDESTDRLVQNVDQLPASPFHVVKLNLALFHQTGFKGAFRTAEFAEQLEKLKHVREASLVGEQVSPAVISALCQNLDLERVSITFTGSRIGDDEIKLLENLKALTFLKIENSELTDIGLEHLRALKLVANLHVRGTKVTAAGITNFQAVNPNCKIDWNGTDDITKEKAPASVASTKPMKNDKAIPAKPKKSLDELIEILPKTQLPKSTLFADEPEGLIKTLEGQPEGATNCWFSFDGSAVHTSYTGYHGGAPDPVVRSWELKTGRLATARKSQGGRAFPYPPKKVAAIANLDSLYVLNLATGASTPDIKVPRGPLCWSKDGALIAVAGQETGIISVIDRLGKMIHEYNSGKGVQCLSFAQQDEAVVFASSEQIKIWRFKEDEVRELRQHSTPVVRISSDPSTEYIMSIATTWDRPVDVAIWHPDHPNKATSLIAGETVTAFDVSEDWRRLVTAEKDGSVAVWDIPTESQSRRITIDAKDRRPIDAIAISRSGLLSAVHQDRTTNLKLLKLPPVENVSESDEAQEARAMEPKGPPSSSKPASKRSSRSIKSTK